MASRRPPPKWLIASRKAGRGEVHDWVSRALSRSGVLPFKEAEAAVHAGRVALDGRKVKEPLTPLQPSSVLTLDGAQVTLHSRTLVLAFHKPKGVVTATVDQHDGAGTVFEVLRAALPAELHQYGWHAVGRLDRDTTGLLLFTNDERFVAHATQPDTHLPKRYLARVGGAVTEAKLEKLRAGIKLGEALTRPSQARAREKDVVELVLTQGRYHQVKQMLNAVGLPTLELHREAIGSLVLDVEPGAARLLSDDEVRERLGYEPRR